MAAQSHGIDGSIAMNPIPWLRLLAHDGCGRHVHDSARERHRSRRVARYNERVMTELRLALMTDAAAFDDTSDVRRPDVALCSISRSPHGFVVTARLAGTTRGTVSIELSDGRVICRFAFPQQPGRADEHAYAIRGGPDDAASFCMWRQGVATRFATTAALSRHLLKRLNVSA